MRPHRTPLLVLIAILAAFLAAPAQAAPPHSGTVRLTILQVNDVYQISPVDKGRRGGLARLATLVRQTRLTSPHTLFVLGGDTLSPSVASRVFRGAQMIALWNALGLDFATFGNHEFDFGLSVLRQRMRESRFPWVTANAWYKHDRKPIGTPYVIRSMGGIKVGVFGLVTTETRQSSKPGPNVVFTDPIAEARAVVGRMRREGADVIIGLTHLEMREDQALAAAVPQIDIICGGHEHILLQSLVGHTPILKAACDARNLGRFDLVYDRGRRRIASMEFQFIPVNEDVPAAEDVAALVNRYEARLDAALDKPVGHTTVALDARRETSRTQETNLGNFICDAYRAATGADVALTNGGSIRSDAMHPPGPLTLKDIMTFLPFENPIVKLEVKGSTLRAALEHGVAKAGSMDNGAFPHVSGISFRYDARRPEGHRVLEASVNGSPLRMDKSYTLATNAYVQSGGDGYDMFRRARVLVSEDEGPIDATVVADAVKAAGSIAPCVEGRVRRVDGEAN